MVMLMHVPVVPDEIMKDCVDTPVFSGSVVDSINDGVGKDQDCGSNPDFSFHNRYSKAQDRKVTFPNCNHLFPPNLHFRVMVRIILCVAIGRACRRR